MTKNFDHENNKFNIKNIDKKILKLFKDSGITTNNLNDPDFCNKLFKDCMNFAIDTKDKFINNIEYQNKINNENNFSTK